MSKRLIERYNENGRLISKHGINIVFVAKVTWPITEKSMKGGLIETQSPALTNIPPTSA